ncbi:MAG: DUF4148 domain-containing protein [Lautropia sp.]
MKKIAVMIPALALGLLIAQGVQAQPKPAPAAPQGEMSPQMKNMPSTRTRAEVQKECNDALKAGRTPAGECSPGPEGKSTKTRAEVKAECEKMMASGKAPAGECTN